MSLVLINSGDFTCRPVFCRSNLSWNKVHLLSCASTWLSCSGASQRHFLQKRATEASPSSATPIIIVKKKSTHSTNFVFLSLLPSRARCSPLNLRSSRVTLPLLALYERKQSQSSAPFAARPSLKVPDWPVGAGALTWEGANSERDASSSAALCVCVSVCVCKAVCACGLRKRVRWSSQQADKGNKGGSILLNWRKPEWFEVRQVRIVYLYSIPVSPDSETAAPLVCERRILLMYSQKKVSNHLFVSLMTFSIA